MLRRTLTLLIFAILMAGCFDNVLVIHDDVASAPSHVQVPQRYAQGDITIDVPEHLVYVPMFGKKSRRAHTIMYRYFAITQDRIYLPDGAGLNIYVFDRNGTHLPDETITREPLGDTRFSKWDYRSEPPDRLEDMAVYDDRIYLLVRFTHWNNVIDYHSVISIGIYTGDVQRHHEQRTTATGRMMGMGLVDGNLCLKQTPGGIWLDYWHQYRSDVLRGDTGDIRLQHDFLLDFERENREPVGGDAFLPDWSEFRDDQLHAMHAIKGKHFFQHKGHIYVGWHKDSYSIFNRDGIFTGNTFHMTDIYNVWHGNFVQSDGDTLYVNDFFPADYGWEPQEGKPTVYVLRAYK